jgi:hypothetical protein
MKVCYVNVYTSRNCDAVDIVTGSAVNCLQDHPLEV